MNFRSSGLVKHTPSTTESRVALSSQAGPAEDEEDGRQHLLRVHGRDDVRRLGHALPARPAEGELRLARPLIPAAWTQPCDSACSFSGTTSFQVILLKMEETRLASAAHALPC